MSWISRGFLTFFVFLFSFQTQATTFAPVPFPQSVKEAPVIVRGTIGNSYSNWAEDSEGERRIYTYYEVTVQEVLKGEGSPRSLLIREVGGEKDGIGLHVPGTARFSRGEDTVVFLQSKNTEGTYPVQGMMMGKYSIVTDSDGAEALSGPGLLEEGIRGKSKSHQWTLESLRQLIKAQNEDTKGEKKSALPTNPPSQALSPTNSPAPQLQQPSAAEAKPDQSLIFKIGAGILFALGGFFVFRMISRNKK